MRRIGLVGVGLLGSAVARRLLQHGFEVIGYETRTTQSEALQPQGLRAAGSVAEAGADTDAVFTILPSFESVEAVICGPEGLVETASRRTVISQMSTISPEPTRRLHTVAAAVGLAYLDAPISGTSVMVARGYCTILVGGDPAVVQRCRPIFDAIADQTVPLGDVGKAALAKLVTNLLVAFNTAALAEALVLAAKGGLDPATLLGALQHSAAGSRMLDVRGPLMVSGTFPPQMKLDLFLKDLRLMMGEGQRLNVPLPLTAAAQQLHAAAAAAGAGAEDLAVDITQLACLAGLTRAPIKETPSLPICLGNEMLRSHHDRSESWARSGVYEGC